MKEKIDSILFGTLEIKKKRIEVRKLAREGLDKKYIKMFLKLLEYIDQILYAIIGVFLNYFT